MAGQKAIAIDGFKISGCSARKAKLLMGREAGQILPLLVKNPDGSEQVINISVE
ncbi:hypothetical protein R50072_36180 [Simiduia litorea]|uniref:hypothetical protein n=1 Tax=Simiduia litorea TaxID=1435348 RepID=UPI0036F282C4